eukprot:COSAG04_NODE_28162_length_277_cov_0.876404_1_plen_44_part_01
MNPVMEWKKETGSGTTGKEPGDGDGGGDEEALPPAQQAGPGPKF